MLTTRLNVCDCNACRDSLLWQRQYDKKPEGVCRFGSGCTRPDCKWAHACKLCTEGANEKRKLKACKHGIVCRNSPCQFAHPSPSLTCDRAQGQITPTFDEVQAVIVILQESGGQLLFCIFCIASHCVLFFKFSERREGGAKWAQIEQVCECVWHACVLVGGCDGVFIVCSCIHLNTHTHKRGQVRNR